MNWWKRLQEYFAFTKNEQKVFLFLSLVLIAGVSIKIYKAYITPPLSKQFDYSGTDREFEDRSKRLHADPNHAGPGLSGKRKKVDLNTATKGDLVNLPGIGEAIAEQIILYRDEHGKFSHIAELKKIKGIGAKKFEKLRESVEIK